MSIPPKQLRRNRQLNRLDFASFVHYVSRQAVRDAVKRGEALLTEYEAKLGFAAQHTACVEKLEELQHRIGTLGGRIPPEQLSALADCAAQCRALIE